MSRQSAAGEIWDDEITAAPEEPIDWIWQGFIAPGNLTLLTSRWKAGKTTLLSILLGLRRAGGAPGGLAVRPGKTLVISEEAASFWNERARKDQFGGNVCFIPQPFRAIPTPEQWQELIGRASDRPMLAVSNGRLICLSTPFGKRGFFHDCWTRSGSDWHRIEVPADRVPRITQAFLEEERRALGDSWFRQEYGCSFEALEGLVYPDFARCVMPGPAHVGGTRAGGIDFGFRNPFAALWGVVKDGVLILTGEHYLREKPLSHHVKILPRDVMWYADPSGANEIAELLCGGFKVRGGNNSLAPGIAAVTDRLTSGRLRVLEGTCPNLLAEAGLYRYGNAGAQQRSEIPVDEDNHALAALRHLICALDRRKMAGGRPSPIAANVGTPPCDDADAEAAKRARQRRREREALWNNPDVWGPAPFW